METPKDGKAADKNAAENSCRDLENQERIGSTDAADDVDVVADSQPSRRPFTSLSQEDSDLILARALQEQERAYMMLRMGGGEYESSHSGSYVNEEEDDDDDDKEEDDDDHLHEDVDAGADVNEIEGEIINEDISEGFIENVEVEGEEDVVGNRDENNDDDDDDEEEDEDDEDVFDVHERELEEEIDPANFDSDEAYARALQEAEERGLAARMMAIASINEWEDEGDEEEDTSYSQDTWQEVDPDELSYEELLALSEVVGNESRGLSADVLALLPSSVYNPKNSLNGTSDQCVICRVDYEEGERVIILSCKHTYHAECINDWLQINKVCPVCNVEVSASTHG